MMLMCIFWTGAKRQQAFSFDKFKEKLKKSVAAGSTGVHDDSLPNTEREVAEQMAAFNAAIGSNSRLNTYNYCMIGRNLGELLKGGKRGKKLIDFVQHYLPAKHYSGSQIYFLIDLYKVAQEYSQLMFVTLGIGVLKTKFRYVKLALTNDKEFWQ